MPWLALLQSAALFTFVETRSDVYFSSSPRQYYAVGIPLFKTIHGKQKVAAVRDALPERLAADFSGVYLHTRGRVDTEISISIRNCISILALMACPALVWAQPVYIECELSSGSESTKFSVKLDEASGKITHTRQNGSAFNAEGFFAAKTISYQSVTIVSPLKITYKYEIDRTDLSAKEVFVAEPVDPALAAKIASEPIIKSGSCTVVEVQDRKI